MLSGAFRSHPVIVIGHRGSPLRAPENTLLSFQKALGEGAHGIECDVRLSRDHQVAVFHDENFYRTMGCRGMRIERLLSPEIKTLRIGKRLGFSNQQGVPLLKELFRGLSDSLFYIELKAETLSRGGKHILAVETMELLEKFNLVSRSMLVSFDYSLVKWVKQEDPEFSTGLNFTRMSDLTLPQKDHFRYLDCLCPKFSCLTPKLMEEARSYSLDVLVWVVNDLKALRRAVKLGVRGIATDDPRKIVSGLRGQQQV